MAKLTIEVKSPQAYVIGFSNIPNSTVAADLDCLLKNEKNMQICESTVYWRLTEAEVCGRGATPQFYEVGETSIQPFASHISMHSSATNTHLQLYFQSIFPILKS